MAKRTRREFLEESMMATAVALAGESPAGMAGQPLLEP